MTLSYNQLASAAVTFQTSVDLSPLSTGSDVLIVLFTLMNGSVQVSSIADLSGLDWQRRASVDLGGPRDFEYWYAISTEPLSDNLITLSLTGESSFIIASAFSIVGADLDAPFEGDPVFGDYLEQVISSVSNNTMIIGGYRQSTAINPTAGTGFTQVYSDWYLLTEFAIFDTPQTSLTVACGTGAGDIDTGIADVIVAAAEVEPPVIVVDAVEAVVIPMTGVMQFNLTDFETANGEVVEAVYDEETGDLVALGSTYVYEQDIGGVTYRVTAINPVIVGDQVTFTLRDAEQIS